MRMLFLVPALLLFSTTALAVDELPVSKELGPMGKWAQAEVGYLWEGVKDDGKTVRYELLAIEDGEAKWRDKTGCTWTLPGEFAPITAWSDCSGGGTEAGSQNIYETEGSPWPLTDDTKFSYKYTGVGGGYSWRSIRECEVAEQVRVNVPAGEYDTYKVYCEDKWNKRTWWVSPELEEVVAFKSWHKEDRKRRYTEMLVKIVEPE